MAYIDVAQSGTGNANMRLRIHYSTGNGYITVSTFSGWRTDGYTTYGNANFYISFNGGQPISLGWLSTNFTANSSETYFGDFGDVRYDVPSSQNVSIRVTFSGSGVANIDNSIFSTSVYVSKVNTPTINTPSISNITRTTANASFTVANNGGASMTDYYIDAFTDSGLTNKVSTISSSSGTFSGLSPNTYYYVRANGSNGTSRGYSSIANFYTKHNAPSIGSLIFSHVRNEGTYTTTFGYDVTYDNTSYSSRKIEYGTSSDNLNNSVSGTKTITGLSPNTTYYYKITETDNGKNDTTTGTTTGSFLTPCEAPSDLSMSLSGFDTSSITLSLRATGDTNAPITEYMVYYKPKCDFTQEDVDLVYSAYKGEITLTPEQIEKYDSVGNNNGVIDLGDVAALNQLIQSGYTSVSTTSSSITINDLQEDTTYEFYFEAINEGGTTRSTGLYYFSTNLFEKDEYTRNITIGEVTPFTVEITDDVTISIDRDIVYSYTYVDHNNYDSIIDLTQGEEVTSTNNTLTALGPQSVRAEITDSSHIAYMKITNLLSEKGWYTIHTGDFVTSAENMKFGIRKIYTLGGRQDHSAYIGEGNVCRFYYSPNDMKDYYFWISTPGTIEITEPITVELNNITFQPFKYTSSNPGYTFTNLMEETEYKFYASFTILSLGINARDYWNTTTLTVTTPADQAKVRIRTKVESDYPVFEGYTPVQYITATALNQRIELDHHQFFNYEVILKLKWNDVTTEQNIGSNIGGYFGVSNGYYTSKGVQTTMEAVVGRKDTIRLVSEFIKEGEGGIVGSGSSYQVTLYVNDVEIDSYETMSTSSRPSYGYFYLFGVFGINNGSTASIYSYSDPYITLLPYKAADGTPVFISQNGDIYRFDGEQGEAGIGFVGWLQGKTYYKLNGSWVKAKKIYKKIEGQWIIGTNN